MSRTFAALLMLLLAALSFSSSFGYSRITLTRTWDVQTSAPFNFTGALAVNDSSQHVRSVSVEPAGMEVYSGENGTVMLRYAGNGSVLMKAVAVIDVDYDPQLSSDPALPLRPLPSSNLTAADDAISAQAQELAHGESALLTIRDLVNWVNANVEYDISYWSKSKSARDVYAERRGVCVEYSHLLISMARSLGLESRYVSGYAYTSAWQPHAWAEIYVPGQGWIAADPTFGQAGILDSTHVAIRRSDDQSASYDILLAEDENVSIRAIDSLESDFVSEDPKGASLKLEIDKEDYSAEVTLTNSRPNYLFGSYSTSLPDNYGGEERSVILLRPSETMLLYRSLDRSLFQQGFLYEVPISASFNDARSDAVISVDNFGIPDGYGEEKPSGLCAGPAALALAMLLSLALAKR